MDLVAPGADILSTTNSEGQSAVEVQAVSVSQEDGLLLKGMTLTEVNLVNQLQEDESRYERLGGTSMATSVVSGADIGLPSKAASKGPGDQMSVIPTMKHQDSS